MILTPRQITLQTQALEMELVLRTLTAHKIRQMRMTVMMQEW